MVYEGLNVGPLVDEVHNDDLIVPAPVVEALVDITGGGEDGEHVCLLLSTQVAIQRPW